MATATIDPDRGGIDLKKTGGNSQFLTFGYPITHENHEFNHENLEFRTTSMIQNVGSTRLSPKTPYKMDRSSLSYTIHQVCFLNCELLQVIP